MNKFSGYCSCVEHYQKNVNWNLAEKIVQEIKIQNTHREHTGIKTYSAVEFHHEDGSIHVDKLDHMFCPFCGDPYPVGQKNKLLENC